MIPLSFVDNKEIQISELFKIRKAIAAFVFHRHVREHIISSGTIEWLR